MLRTSIAIAVAAAFAVPASAEGLTQARWLSPEADKVAALTLSPGECLTEPADADNAYLVEVGRAAFNSPLLMGGQAARGGLSCAACHVDGRSNPDFFLAGLSGPPGTADVTTSIFSQVRDDGEFNPVPIPTLLNAREKETFGAATRAPSLHAFISAAIVDEFQAEPPPPKVFDGLIAYIESFDAAACPDGPTAQTARRALNDAMRVAEAAKAAIGRGDYPTADFLLASCQFMLGRISERFPFKKGARLRSDLAVLSRDIGQVRKAPDSAGEKFAAIEKSAARLGKRLHKARRISLYDPDALKDFLKSRDRD
ncbi:MAG: hypothetical protein KDD85_11235 [Parvularculaceae bacterium]|nr:hypothetical protein [Parvularculaceae bacterium]